MKFEEEMTTTMMMVENDAEVDSSGTEEEFGGSIRPQIIAKRKRTKRRRLSVSGAVVCNSVSSTDAGGEKDRNYESSTTTATATEEEEDMANCLILLARSGSRCRTLTFSNEDEVNFQKSSVKTETEIRKTISSSSLIPNGVYECKMCDKEFQSFQALGGHRASHHKKPKNISPEDPTVKHPTAKTSAIHSTSNLSNAVTHNVSAKVHECSICGSVFSSGQALGGHMRKHRTITTTAAAALATAAVDGETEQTDTEKYIRKDDNDNNTNNKFLASLDLNKPAPAEEEQDGDDQMRQSQRRRLFAVANVQGSVNPSTTAPPLVGCYF